MSSVCLWHGEGHIHSPSASVTLGSAEMLSLFSGLRPEMMAETAQSGSVEEILDLGKEALQDL